MQTRTSFASIAGIQNLFDRWRQLGQRTLPCGTELIAAGPDKDSVRWLHVVYPGLSVADLERLEEDVPGRIPRALRTFYRRCAGMNLWNGAFQLYGYNPGIHDALEQPRYPGDVLRFNHNIDVLGWMAPEAFAFAENGWDMSVHIVGMNADDPNVVHRCDRRTGEVLETHPHIWACLESRLNKLDQLLVQSTI